MRAGQEAALVVVACAMLYLGGLATIPFYTRGEPREGLVVREMLATGNWLVPARPAGEPARKPPLYYWAAAACLAALPTHPELALRLPSALLGTAGVLVTWGTARAVVGPAAGLPAALVLAAAFEWARAATSARVDMTLAAALALVLAAWASALTREKRARGLLATAGAALGTLAKGPVALVLPGLAATALAVVRREPALLRRLRVVPTLTGAAVLAGAWYAVAFAREGGAFLEVVVRENLLRFVDPERGATGHAHGSLYLGALGLVGFLPWTPLLPLALAPLVRRPRSPAASLALAWVATGTVFFSLAAAKRSVYLLPLFPAVALLIADGVVTPPAEGRLATACRLGAWVYPPLAIVVAALALVYAAGIDPTQAFARHPPPETVAATAALAAAARHHRGALALLALATAAGAVPLARAARGGAWRRTVLVTGTLAVAWVATFELVGHPALARTASLADFMTEVDALVPVRAPLYASFPPDPALRFYSPRPLRTWPTRDATDTRYVLLWEDEWARLGALEAAGAARRAGSSVRQEGRGRLLLVAVPAGLTTGATPGRPPGNS